MGTESRLEAAAVEGARAGSAPGTRSAPYSPETLAPEAGAFVDDAEVRRTVAAFEELLGPLFAEPQRFDFFHAVHLLERIFPERAPVGEFADPGDEVVRFRTATAVSFPTTEIQGLEPTSVGQPPRMIVNFLGLTGPQGVLPLAYSLYIAERVRAGDRALKDFLGIFDHRLISLFFRAWEKSHVGVAFDRGAEQRDWFTRHLQALIGIETGGLQERLPLSDQSLLYYAGLLALPTRPAAALEQLLTDFFGVTAEVEQFVGAWYPLERATQSELGDETSASSQLGFGAVAGHEIWDQQSRVRVRLGPLTRAQYDRFLPGGAAYEPLTALCRFFANDQIDFQIQLILARDEVPACQLGSDAPLPLSWCTWLRTSALQRDPDDTVLSI